MGFPWFPRHRETSKATQRPSEDFNRIHVALCFVQMESLQEANEKLEENIEQSQAMQKQLQQDLQDSQRRQDETTADNEKASRRIARHQSREAAAQVPLPITRGIL